jgi:hypothetical protein
MGIIKRGTAVLLVLVIITISQPLEVFAIQPMHPTIEPGRMITLSPDALLAEQGFVGFEPALAPILVATAKYALAMTLLTAAGVAVTNIVDWETAGPALFGDQFWVSYLWDQLLLTGVDLPNEPTPTRVSVQNPATGEIKEAIPIPMSLMQEVFGMASEEMKEFIGPIDMTAAQAAWDWRQPFGVHVPGGPPMELIGFNGLFNGVPVFNRYAQHDVILYVLKRYGTTTAVFGGSTYTLGPVGMNYSPWQNTASRGPIYRNGTIYQHWKTYSGTPDVSSVRCLGFMITHDPGGSLRYRLGTAVEMFNASGHFIRFDERSLDPPIGGWIDAFDIVMPGYSGNAFDLSLDPKNLVNDPAAALALVGQLSGAHDPDDYIYMWLPQNFDEFMAMVNAAAAGEGNYANVAVIPDGWQVLDDDDVPLIPSPGTITQDWLDGVRDGIDGIRDGQNARQEWEQEVGETLGGMAGVLSSVNTGVNTIAHALTTGLIGDMNIRFDPSGGGMTTKFPFSIPFDLARALSSLAAVPEAPRFEIDLSGTILDANRFGGQNQQDGGEVFDESGMHGAVWVLDLSDFEGIAYVIRWSVWISFMVGLILITPKIFRI